MKISIVTSLYNSSSFINTFYKEYIKIVNELNVTYEFIFVDDGSEDSSVNDVLKLIKFDNSVKLIELSRNFGQYQALYSGLSIATGDYIYICDVDLEEPPVVLIQLYQKITSSNLDLIYTYFTNRKGGFVRAYLGSLFYKLLNYLSDVKIKENQSWQRIMTKDYLKSLLLFKEYETLPSGLFTLNGYNQEAVLIERKYKGYTSYNPKKRINQAINGLVSFSSKPLVLISKLGFSITFITLLFLIYILIKKLFYVDFQIGWSSLFVSIWLVGGIIIFSIGVIGIYVSKIFNQTKNRPLFIIKKIHQKESNGKD